MKVTVENKSLKALREVENGECFCSGGEFYIATEKYSEKNWRICVEILKGGVAELNISIEVTPVDAEVVVHD